MEKNIAHPTDARLYEKARLQLVALADEGGITLRQNYNRLAPRLALQVERYAHAPTLRDHLQSVWPITQATVGLKWKFGGIFRNFRPVHSLISAEAMKISSF
ncbi:hypothetical protein IMCC21224_113484 [Puniceibacterium sp. IMCC21224]|nr:hypothetical protein IMCC21224_113484 [Puniceibacterium sp. IMCC21224]